MRKICSASIAVALLTSCTPGAGSADLAAIDALVEGPPSELGVDAGRDGQASPADAMDQEPGDLPSSGELTLELAAEADAISAYLMSGSAWNLLYGPTVYLGRRSDGAHVSYHTALRFVQVPIPRGATIESAELIFYPQNDVDSSKNLWLEIYGEKSADSLAFDPTDYETNRPDQRRRTDAFIDHLLVRCNADCTDLSEYDCPQRKLDCWRQSAAVTLSRDLGALVQEVVAQSDWSPGNALTLLLLNAATDEDGVDYRDNRAIVGFDVAKGAAFAPKLVVRYAR